jgi:hypothetical protein
MFFFFNFANLFCAGFLFLCFSADLSTDLPAALVEFISCIATAASLPYYHAHHYLTLGGELRFSDYQGKRTPYVFTADPAPQTHLLPHHCTCADAGTKAPYDCIPERLRQPFFKEVRGTLAKYGGGTLLPVAPPKAIAAGLIEQAIHSASTITLLINVQRTPQRFHCKIDGKVTTLTAPTGHMIVAGPGFVYTPAFDDLGTSGHIHVTLMSQSVAEELQGEPGFIWPLRRAAIEMRKLEL